MQVIRARHIAHVGSGTDRLAPRRAAFGPALRLATRWRAHTSRVGGALLHLVGVGSSAPLTSHACRHIY
jgi:hypothetical protein